MDSGILMGDNEPHINRTGRYSRVAAHVARAEAADPGLVELRGRKRYWSLVPAVEQADWLSLEAVMEGGLFEVLFECSGDLALAQRAATLPHATQVGLNIEWRGQLDGDIEKTTVEALAAWFGARLPA